MPTCFCFMFTFIVWDLKPDIIEVGYISIRWYSLLFALGFILSYLILKGYFVKEHIKPFLLDRLTVYVVASTVIGARLGHCLFYEFDYYSNHIFEIFLPVEFDPVFKFTGYQGLAGAIAIFLALVIFAKQYKTFASL